jgi:hypothetical protein
MIHHGDTEARSKLLHEKLTEHVIGAAIEVHRELGPGLMESAYEECLYHELHLRNLNFQRQLPLPVQYIRCRSRLRISDRSRRRGFADTRTQVPRASSAGPRSTTPDILKTERKASWADSKFQCFGPNRRRNYSKGSLISVPPCLRGE